MNGDLLGIQTPWGTELEASKVIANTDELERFDTADKKVSYAWKEKPNFEPGVSVDHHVPGVVVVTYPDGSGIRFWCCDDDFN